MGQQNGADIPGTRQFRETRGGMPGGHGCRPVPTGGRAGAGGCVSSSAGQLASVLQPRVGQPDRRAMDGGAFSLKSHAAGFVHSSGGGWRAAAVGSAQRSPRQAHAVPLDGLEEAGNHLALLHLQEEGCSVSIRARLVMQPPKCASHCSLLSTANHRGTTATAAALNTNSSRAAEVNLSACSAAHIAPAAQQQPTLHLLRSKVLRHSIQQLLPRGGCLLRRRLQGQSEGLAQQQINDMQAGPRAGRR